MNQEKYFRESLDDLLEIKQSFPESCRLVALQPFDSSRSQTEKVISNLNNVLEIETPYANKVPMHIKQKFRSVKVVEKELEIVEMVKQNIKTIIFANKNTQVHHICRILDMYNLHYLYWDGKVPRNDQIESHARPKRRFIIDTLNNFNKGVANTLITTDAFGRGVDFSDVKRVINWSPPYNSAIYLNRIGRMGRVNHSFVGEAITYRYSILLATVTELIFIQYRSKYKFIDRNDRRIS